MSEIKPTSALDQLLFEAALEWHRNHESPSVDGLYSSVGNEFLAQAEKAYFMASHATVPGSPVARQNYLSGLVVGAIPRKGQHVVYRHWGDGELLYVGVTSRFAGRQADHRRMSSWWIDVDRITINSFSTRNQALVGEAVAIRDEEPLHNGPL